MGEVYLAEDVKLNRQVAIKTLRSDYFDQPERGERFKREAKTAAQISHAHVSGIYDIGSSTNPATGREINYIVMEYIKGQSLSDFLSTRASTTAELLRIAEKIASGVAAAHKLNIVHRDIKAENILINEDGEPKILDFGLAKPLTPLKTDEKPISGETVKAELTKMGTLIGTVSYMSPEQARGETVDHRSDIFSFGVLLFRMFTGQMPFTGSSQVATLAKILESKHPQPRTVKADIDPEIERIIDKCLQKSPDDRYQDTRDLVLDLRNLRRQYDSDVSVTGSDQARSGRLSRALNDELNKRRRRRLMLVAPLLLIVLAIVLIRNWGSEPLETVQAHGYTLAILSFEDKTGDPELAWLSTGLPEILLTDLGQQQSIRLIGQRRLLETPVGRGKAAEEFGYGDQLAAARSLGAIHALTGVILKSGDKIRIDARLEDIASGRIIFADKVVGNEPFAIVDSLTRKIALSLRIDDTGFGDRGVAQLTTSNPEAYRYYHLGLDKFLDGLHDDARDLFLRAIEIDSAFAMPYLRIGMSYVFQGRMQEAVPFLVKAKNFQDRLPLRDRGLLDAYADFWLHQQFDEGVVKMKTLVRNFPEDIEARSVYALLLWQIYRDSTAALSELQEVLRQAPGFQLALGFIIQVYMDIRDYDGALNYSRRFIEMHPDAPSGYISAAAMLIRKGELDSAQYLYEILRTRYPDQTDAVSALADIAIRKRDFAAAERYMEEYRRIRPDDPFTQMSYWNFKSNLSAWRGQFQLSLSERRRALEAALGTGDSVHICNTYSMLAAFSERYEMPDSALAAYRSARNWAKNLGQSLGALIGIVALSPAHREELRIDFEREIVDFRSRIPSEMYYLVDNLQLLFEGHLAADTAKLLDGLRGLAANDPPSSGNWREYGILLILSGKYQEGADILKQFVSGGHSSTSAWVYLHTHYYLGVAAEGLGNKSAAAEHYQELLKFWGDADLELQPIKDARARLAQLRS